MPRTRRKPTRDSEIVSYSKKDLAILLEIPMTELQQRIEEKAEKIYPIIMIDGSSYFTANETQLALRKARINGSMEWAQKLENIRDEVSEQQQQARFDIEQSMAANGTPWTGSIAKNEVLTTILSIIDKHLKE